MEQRKVNIIYNKNGKGNVTNKVTLPVPWVRKLGFMENDKMAVLVLTDNNEIILKKERKEK